MKIAIFGAKGMIGQRILQEALERGHDITVVVRDPAAYDSTNPKVKAVQGDATDSESVAAVVAGQDAVIVSIAPGHNGKPEIWIEAAHALIAGLNKAGVSRLLIVGGAGSLEVAPGLKLHDSPDFPAAWKDIAKALGAALEVYRTTDLDWTFFSPAIMIEPGERTGKFRIGKDQVLFDEQGQSRISAEDFAVAMLDELENTAHLRERITVTY
jgi:putative NADH-flavin reductase